MARNILEDIKPAARTGKNALPEYKNISEPRPARASQPVLRHFAEEMEAEHSRGKGPWIISLISLAILFFAFSFLFARATVIVTPKKKNVELSETFVANKDSTDAASLSFQLMTLSADDQTTITNATAKTVSQKASGRVIVYNDFSPAPQHFSPDTRIQTKDGKIYKISGAVTVPGTTMKAGQTTPGSLEVTAYAEKPGDGYNIGLSDFTIFGFKGTPKYDKFYARSKTAMTGGSNGLMYVANDADVKTAYAALSLKLHDKLIKQARAELPKGFLLYDDAALVAMSDEPATLASKDAAVPLPVHATLYGFILDEKNLTQKIAESALSDYDGKPLSIPNISDLSLVLKNKDKISPADVTQLTFLISGNASLVWDVDRNKIAQALIGRKKNEFPNILSGFSNIDTAKVTIKPLWRNSFPEKAKDISVINMETEPALQAPLSAPAPAGN